VFAGWDQAFAGKDASWVNGAGGIWGLATEELRKIQQKTLLS